MYLEIRKKVNQVIWNDIMVKYFFTKGDVLRNVHTAPFHTVKVMVNGCQNGIVKLLIYLMHYNSSLLKSFDISIALSEEQTEM